MQPIVRRLCVGVESLTLPDARFKTAQITVGLFLPLSRDTVEEYAILSSLPESAKRLAAVAYCI